MEKLKVFISMPMNGLNDDEIKQKMHETKLVIMTIFKEKFDVEFLDSFINDTPINIKELSVWYLGKSIEILANADLVYFCKGWERARGCMIENLVAEMYHITTIDEIEDDENEETNE